MKRNLFILLIILIAFIACENTTQSDKDVAILEGTVYGLDQNNQLTPLENALVTVVDFFEQTKTSINGEYKLRLELDNVTEQEQLKLEVSKAGYQKGSADIVARKGESVQVPDITMYSMVSDTSDDDDADTTGVSGPGDHIEIVGSHVQHVYVLGSGLRETARIDFAVKDAQGVPVDENHRVKVRFKVFRGPDGGEYVNPDTMTTNKGFVHTVLNSGIVSGPVQVQATATVDGRTISAAPVRLAIYGGLPDRDHFSLAADILNIAGLKYSGLIDKITAYVGDKYSNPVAPGTVVYFSSDYGIVQGSAETDKMGRATVEFMSASPRPPSPSNDAFVHITGWTYSDTLEENNITSDTRVLLTDNTAPIQFTPSSFNYGSGNTPVNFEYVVNDVWGRPLVGDSKVSVTATEGELYGDTDVTIEDTQIGGPGTTQFNFTWTPGDSLDAPQVHLNIKVTTPQNGNGYQSVTVVGNKE